MHLSSAADGPAGPLRARAVQDLARRELAAVTAARRRAAPVRMQSPHAHAHAGPACSTQPIHHRPPAGQGEPDHLLGWQQHDL